MNHTVRVLGVTRGSLGYQNDQTMIRSDRTVLNVRDNAETRDRAFSLRRAYWTLREWKKGNNLIIDCLYHQLRTVSDGRGL